MASLRQERVRELLKRQVGEIIRRELPVEEVGIITVNEIGVSNDLHSAKVFVGLVGNDLQRKRAVELLKKESKRIQSLLGRAVILKYTPQLSFVVDDSITKGNRVLQILDELEKDSPQDEDTSENH
ncbi:MAG: 30S ribosome-binding factor RbfA [Verrucomicrobiota bacterium]|nr:30S ribosome-binding factor RbfA [Verrucomicrobiota bacterium]